MRKKDWGIILIVFLFSVLIRIPNLNRPLSKHHEFNTAFFLIPMEIWYESSVSDYYYSPILNYENAADKEIRNFTPTKPYHEGDYYYLSFGAGAYLIPYFFLSPFGVPSVLGLQVFSLLIHLCCSIFLVLIFKLFLKEKELDEKYAVLPGIIYLLLPETLWFHGNGYTHHSLAVLFFLMSLFFTFRLFSNPKQTGSLILLFLSIFLTIYTEWIGCILAFVICLVFLFKRDKAFIPALMIVFLSTIVSVVLIFYQYSSILGFETFSVYLKNRFLTRSTISGESTSYLMLLKKLGIWYVVGFAPLFLFIPFYIRSIRNTTNPKLNKCYWLLIFSPVVIHHFVFAEFTYAHDYSILIDAVFLCLVIAWVLVKNKDLLSSKKRITGFSVLFIAASTIQYYYINRPGEYSQKGERYDSFKRIGTFIRENAKKDEVIFIQDLPDLPNPQVIYYAKRNIYTLKDIGHFDKILKSRKEKKAFLVVIEGYKVKTARHVRI